MKVEKVTNLPMKYRKNCSSFVKLSLSTSKKNKTSYYTNVIQRTLNPVFDECFDFKLNNAEEEEKLKLSVFVKYHLKDKFIGETVQIVTRNMFSDTDSERYSNMSANLNCKKAKKKVCFPGMHHQQYK